MHVDAFAATYLWMRRGGRLHVLKGLAYDHRMHDGSYSLVTREDTTREIAEIRGAILAQRPWPAGAEGDLRGVAGGTRGNLSVAPSPRGIAWLLPRRMDGSGRMWSRVRVAPAYLGDQRSVVRPCRRRQIPDDGRPFTAHSVSGGRSMGGERRRARGRAARDRGGGVIGRYPAAAARLVAYWLRELNRQHNLVARHLRRRWARQRCIQVPPFAAAAHEDILDYRDYHRYATIAMALSRIEAEGTPARWPSRFIHRLAPRRRYYLFTPLRDSTIVTLMRASARTSASGTRRSRWCCAPSGT